MRAKSLVDEKLNLLVAYPYMTSQVIGVLKEHRTRLRFILDSGAFTAWKLGKPIALDDYCKFLESLQVKPWRYFALDVVGDPHGTLKNYELMLKRGFKPMPVFTRGEDVSVLESYYNTSDVVAIGGLVGTEGNRGFVKGIMEKVGKRKVHWLGFTNLSFLHSLRPYMADSSSWMSGPRYGQTKLYLGNGRTLKLTRKGAMKHLTNFTVRAAISGLGLDPHAFLDPEQWRYRRSDIWKLSARSVVRTQYEFTRLGVNLFAAASIPNDIGHLLDAHNYFLEGGK